MFCGLTHALGLSFFVNVCLYMYCLVVPAKFDYFILNLWNKQPGMKIWNIIFLIKVENVFLFSLIQNL